MLEIWPSEFVQREQICQMPTLQDAPGRVFIEGPVLDTRVIAVLRLLYGVLFWHPHVVGFKRIRIAPSTYGAARSYQSGSRNPRPPDRLAFCRRYSA
jgi:hypothetical protein